MKGEEIRLETLKLMTDRKIIRFTKAIQSCGRSLDKLCETFIHKTRQLILTRQEQMYFNRLKAAGKLKVKVLPKKPVIVLGVKLNEN